MSSKDCSVNNIYQLEGRVPLLKAIPFGLQHILAMFVANLTPITIIAAAGGLSQAEIAVLLQNAMFYCRDCNADSAVSCLEGRIGSANRYGGQLHLCNGFMYGCV